jgi:hypothetical protein
VRKVDVDKYQLLLQLRCEFLSEPDVWCIPGGRRIDAEKVVARGRRLSSSERAWADRRAALREMIEECGGGTCAGKNYSRPFTLAAVVHKGREVASALPYENVTLPPGLLRMLEDPSEVLATKSDKTFFVHLIDPVEETVWSTESWIPLPILDAQIIGYRWVDLEETIRIVTTNHRKSNHKGEVVPGSNIPLMHYQQTHFVGDAAAELLEQLKLLRYLRSRRNMHGDAGLMVADVVEEESSPSNSGCDATPRKFDDSTPTSYGPCTCGNLSQFSLESRGSPSFIATIYHPSGRTTALRAHPSTHQVPWVWIVPVVKVASGAKVIVLRLNARAESGWAFIRTACGVNGFVLSSLL